MTDLQNYSLNLTRIIYFKEQVRFENHTYMISRKLYKVKLLYAENVIILSNYQT